MQTSLSAFSASLFLVFALSLGGCGVNYVSGTISPHFAEYSIKKVAVLPFRTQPVFLDGRISVTPQVGEGSDRLLAQIFTERLRETGKFQVIPQEQVEAAMEDLKKAAEEGSEAITTSFAQKVGKALGIDAVITGEVQAFTERKGGTQAIERPATVGFVAQMMNVKDGRLLWSSEYFETQKALTEDVDTLPLFWKRGGKWLTARELAEYGVEEMIKTLPKARE